MDVSGPRPSRGQRLHVDGDDDVRPVKGKKEQIAGAGVQLQGQSDADGHLGSLAQQL